MATTSLLHGHGNTNTGKQFLTASDVGSGAAVV